jgi:protein dithiol:quinone oxidoreductase
MFPDWLTRRTGNVLGFLGCVGLIAYALYVQYGMGLEPCPLCILQRVAVITAGLLFLAAFLHNPRDRGARVYGVLIDFAALLGILVAARHIWIIAQPPGAVAECGASLEYMMDVLPLHEVLGKVLTGSGECAKIDWHFLGLNMPTWVLMALACVGLWGLLVNWFAPGPGRS